METDIKGLVDWKKVRHGLNAFISGGFGGACLVLVGHPLDLVKVNMQTMPKPLPSQPPLYTGIWDCLAKTFAKDGLFGLYRGMSAPLIAVAPNFATCFLGYDIGIKLARRIEHTPDHVETSLTQIGFAGAFSAFPTLLVLAPGDRIKCLLQAQAQDLARGITPKYKGFTDCAVQLYRTGGWKSIYKGWEATLVREIPCSIGYFVGYEWVKRVLTPANSSTRDLNAGSILLAGGCAGIINWIIAIPPDVIKSRIQTAPEGTYRNFIHCYQVLIKEEGYQGLFKGFRPAIIRAFPSSAACWLGVELSRKFLCWIGLD